MRISAFGLPSVFILFSQFGMHWLVYIQTLCVNWRGGGYWIGFFVGAATSSTRICICVRFAFCVLGECMAQRVTATVVQQLFYYGAPTPWADDVHIHTNQQEEQETWMNRKVSCECACDLLAEAHHRNDMKIDWLLAMVACGRGTEGGKGEISTDGNRATFRDRVPCVL